MRKYKPYKSKVFVDESGKVQFKYQQENNGPCWPGYKQVGTKMKNGKEVPNCVPIDEYNEKVDVQKALKKVKGLTKGQIQTLMTMPPPVLTSLINQLGMLVNSVDEEDVKENKMLAGDADYKVVELKNGMIRLEFVNVRDGDILMKKNDFKRLQKFISKVRV